MNLSDWLVESAARDPQKTAMVFGNESVTYEQLDRSTASLAIWLLEQGCQPGDRVALHWPNSIEIVKLFYACFKAGIIAVPVNVRLRAQEVAYVLTHSKAVLCFAHPDLVDTTREAAKGNALLRKIYTSVDHPSVEGKKVTLPQVDIDDRAIIFYTSGTTARPKGTIHSHRSMIDGVRLVGAARPGFVGNFLVITPMAFISATCGGVFPAVFLGSTVVLCQSFEAPLVLDLIERFRCGYVFGLPAMAQFLIEEQIWQPRDVSSLQLFIAAGDAVPPTVLERFKAIFGFPIREAFGMTEIGPAIVNPPDAIRPGSLGKPIDGVELRVVDSHNADLPDGQTGELLVRSPAMFVEYLDDPAATRAAFTDGWFHTGDLVRRDADGYFWFSGRKKEIIVRDGFNVSPQEVEEAFYSHPAVLEAAVIGRPDPVPAHGEQVIAFVTFRKGMAADPQELKGHVSRRLADIKIPEEVLVLESMPKGITGKIQRRALKDRSVEGTGAERLPLARASA